jgi:hypothetical protein
MICNYSESMIALLTSEEAVETLRMICNYSESMIALLTSEEE